MNKQTENGSHLVIAIVIIVIVGILVALGMAFFNVNQKKSDNATSTTTTDINAPATAVKNPNEPDLKIKDIGINLGYYDSATNRAGDVVFTKTGISQYGNLIFTNYGEISKANSARPTDTLNPQPTFIVPLGTKIRSLVDGVVVRIEKLYSDDYTVMVASNNESNWIYETEHIINPTVKVGDAVKAGQVIAEASTHDSQYHPGFGLYEIGILHGGNPPEHLCPFNYLDDLIKEDVFAKLRAFYASWETYMGDSSLYDESKMAVPGCYTLDPVSDNNNGS